MITPDASTAVFEHTSMLNYQNEPAGVQDNNKGESYDVLPPPLLSTTMRVPTRASRVVAEGLSGKAAGKHAYWDLQGDADTNHDFSSVQCVVLGNVHGQSLVRIDL